MNARATGNVFGSGAIRRAGPHDAEAIREMLSVCSDAPQWPRSAWDAFLGGEEDGPETLRRTLFVAAGPDRRLSGLIAFTSLERTTELELLLVREGSRRQGIGRLLSEEWLEWAMRAGEREALLEVRASNVGARALYEQLGFVTEGRRAGYYKAPGEDALLMRRDLCA